MSASAERSEARRHLTKEHWYLLRVLGAASFFDGYDASIIALALPQIRASYGLTRPAAYLYLSVIFMGTIPALFLARRADIVGRRKLLLFSIVGYTVFSGLTAFSPNIWVFTGLQFCARVFVITESTVSHTMVAEELPAPSRGFGFGFLAMLIALGTGTAAVLNGTLFAAFGWSWRGLYLVGVPPLILITFMRRRLPESKRFEAAKAQGKLAANWREILHGPTRRWLVLVCSVAFLSAMIFMPSELTVDFLRHDRGLSQSLSNLAIVIAGLPAIFLMAWAGALSDRYGRKWIGCGAAALGAVGWLVFYLVDAGLPVLLPALSATIIGFAVANPLIGAYNAELFPTKMRTLSSAWSQFFRACGQSLSFLFGSALEIWTGKLSTTAAILTLGPIAMVVLIALYFPETKGLELEATSGEDLLAVDTLDAVAAVHIGDADGASAGGAGGEHPAPDGDAGTA